jgi:UDP:flavonoid glycosyltransferase YjiC (YdhE family)
MRVTILAFGTRGDVQTMTAFGLGLQSAGHKVRLATQANFENFVTSSGLKCAPISFNLRLPNKEKSKVKTGRLSPFRLYRLARHYAHKALDEIWEASKDAQALAFSDWGRVPGIHIVEKLDTPAVMGLGHPMQMRFLYPETHVFGKAWGWRISRLRKQLLWHLGMKSLINNWRQKTLGLPRTTFWKSENEIKRRKIPLYYAHSPSVFPKPADWPPELHVTGYWFLNRTTDWQPPKDLVQFLGEGPPPICVGFSSMSNREIEELTTIVLQAIEVTGQRSILLSGWSDFGKSAKMNQDIHTLEAAPHDWLFPRCAAIRAGIPSVVIPFALDQPFWGWRVRELSIGETIPPKHLTTEKLATAINKVIHNKAVRHRAAALGTKIRAEDGVGKAVALFNEYVGYTHV